MDDSPAPERRGVIDRGVGDPIATLRRGIRVFASPPGQPRSRRATDVVLLVPALLGLALAMAAYPPATFQLSLQRFLASIPDWLDPVWGFFSDLVWLWAIVLVLVALFRRRYFIVGQAAGAVILAALIGLLAARATLDAWPDLVDAVLGTSRSPYFPNVRLAEGTAVMLTIAPHLVRPIRVLDRWILVLGMVGTAVVGGATPAGTLAAVFIAAAAAAGVRLATGTSIGRPGLEDVAAGLAELGVRANDLEVAEQQVAGVFRVSGVDDSGRPLLVKVYGRDAYDTQLVAKLWRSIWYRGSGPAVGLGRLQSAEHEAFVALLVSNAGLATRDVVTAGATLDDDALLVLRGEARPLASLEGEMLSEELLHGAWKALGVLDELRIAHQQIDPETTVASRRAGRGRLRGLRRRNRGAGSSSAGRGPGSAPHDHGQPRRG